MNNKYYDGNKVLSFGYNINFIIGTRSAGKSFYFKKLVLHNFLKKKVRFIYIYKTEIALNLKAKDYFYDVLKKYYKDYKIEFLQKTKEYYLINKKTNKKEVCGYAFAIKDLNDLSGKTDLEACNYIIFDEFMKREERTTRNNPIKEVEAINQLYITVARGVDKLVRDNVKLIFIANAFTISNPFFIYYDLDKRIRYDKEFYKDKKNKIIVNITQNNEVKKAFSKTKFFEAIKNKDYIDFAFNNKFLLDNNAMIRKRSKNTTAIFNFVVDKKIFTLYEAKNYFIFDDAKTNDKVIDTFYITNDDMKPNYKNIELLKKSKIYKRILTMFYNSSLYFTNNTTLKMFMFIFSI